MANIEETAVSSLQVMEKLGNDYNDREISLPIVDTVIRKIRIANCDTRSSQKVSSAISKNNRCGSLVNGQLKYCDKANVDSTLIGNKYQLFEQVIGSSLYRCVDVEKKQELVCKIVSRDNQSLVSAHHRMDSHPRIQAIHEMIVGQHYLYLVFPNAHGDLHSYVRQRKRLRESEARRLFKQIAETVQLCHHNGIVLRDLKLRKFVFSNPEQTELRLESFEDAVVLEESDPDYLHDKRGCPAYVSPEILKSGQYSGKGADMWSLGVILYTMLVGRYPFNDSGHANLFARISSGTYFIPECISARARCLIRSLLRRNPSERITSEDILHHPWLNKEERERRSRSCDQIVPEYKL